MGSAKYSEWPAADVAEPTDNFLIAYMREASPADIAELEKLADLDREHPPTLSADEL
jgi:hypothetical protein